MVLSFTASHFVFNSSRPLQFFFSFWFMKWYGKPQREYMGLLWQAHSSGWLTAQRWGFLGSSVIKNPTANAGDADSIPMSGRSPGGGNGTPLQYSCLENPMDRGPWWAMVHTVAKSQTRLQRLSTHSADPTESEFSTLFSSFILKIKPLLPASTVLIATLWLVCAHAKLISSF